MAAPFEFSEPQATFILDMQLGQLTRLARINLETELDEKRSRHRRARGDPGDEARKRHRDQGRAAGREGARFATPRRAELTHDVGEITDLELIDDKELVVVMTPRRLREDGRPRLVPSHPTGRQGRIGRTSARGGPHQPGHPLERARLPVVLLQPGQGVPPARARDPRARAHRQGLPIVNLLPLAPDERIQAIIDTRDYETSRYLFFATRKGQVKKTAFTEYDSSRRDGLIAINLRDGDELVKVVPTGGNDDIFMVSRRGMTIRFGEDDVRPMGRAAGRCDRHEDEARRRGRVGRRGPRRRQHPDGHRVGLREAHEARPLQPPGPGRSGRHRHEAHRSQGLPGGGRSWWASTTRSSWCRRPAPPCAPSVRDISSQGRIATGVRVMNLDGGGVVAPVAPIVGDNGDEEPGRPLPRRPPLCRRLPADLTVLDASVRTGGGRAQARRSGRRCRWWWRWRW